MKIDFIFLGAFGLADPAHENLCLLFPNVLYHRQENRARRAAHFVTFITVIAQTAILLHLTIMWYTNRN